MDKFKSYKNESQDRTGLVTPLRNGGDGERSIFILFGKGWDLDALLLVTGSQKQQG